MTKRSIFTIVGVDAGPDDLLDAALDRRAASLWVLDDNPRAHAFYAERVLA